jgi:tetratricopeptide (TPR) repeat protein
MGFAGELTTIGLGEVFQNFAFNRLTGVLKVMERDRHAEVYVEDGKLRAFSHGDDKPFDYALIAERADAAPADDIRTAARRRRRRTLRAMLQKSPNFDERKYDSGVQQAIEEEVILLFGWKSASFTFEERRADGTLFDKEQLECAVSIDPQAVAMEAARRLDEWEGIARQIASEREIFVATQEATEDLPEEAARVLQLLDGTHDLRAILDQLPDPRFHVLKTVADLVENGWATRASADHLRELAQKAQAAGEVHRAASYLEATLEREGGDLDARGDLARLYEKSGRKKEAAREQKRLAFAREERGDLDGALECYERAAVLVPFDTDTLERILKIHDSRAERSEFTKAGRRLAEAYAAQSLHEEARDVYQRLVERDVDNVALREALAATYVKLHEPKKAAEELLVLARRAWNAQDYRDALLYYRNVLAVDRDNAEAQERIGEIESGRVKERVRRRRRRLLLALVTLLVALGCWQAAREWLSAEALHNASLAATSTLAKSPADSSLLSAMERFALVSLDFPYTRAGSQAEETLRVVLLDYMQRVRAATKSRPGSAKLMLAKVAMIEFPDALRDEWESLRDKAYTEIAEREAK